MFCIGCGSTLPDEAQFCPRCGKRTVLGQPPSSPSLSEKLPKTETVEDNGESLRFREQGERPDVGADPQTGIDVDRPAPTPSQEAPEPDNSPVHVSVGPVTTDLKSPKRFANTGSITLGTFALICVVLGAIQGFIPIFLIEGFAFAGLAWLCAFRWPVSDSVRAAVLVVSLLLAVLVGVTLDQDSFGPRYRYLSQGTIQYRIDENAGRTDRLTNSGWYPVAFDKEAKEVPGVNIFDPTIVLTKGQWTSTLGGQICFSVNNSSDYIVDRVTINVTTQKQSDAATGKDSAENKYSGYGNQQVVVLKSYGGGFIGPGQSPLVCGSSPRDLSADETWSYTDMHAYGWKR